MDSRWYGIIIILVVGLGCMYLIASTSTNIGSAVVIVDDLSVTLPPNFKIVNNDVMQVELKNRNNNETIIVKYLNDGNNSMKEYTKEVKLLSKNSNVNITAKNPSDNVKSIYCKNLKNNNEYGEFFLEKFDRTIMIKMTNYDNQTKENNDLKYVVDAIQPDYKQSRK